MKRTTIAKSRHDLEAEISRTMIHFEKEFMGRGPLETRTYVVDDLVIVRLKGVLTPAEQRLAKSKTARSAYLLKQVRNELLESGRPMLEALLSQILGVPVESVHTDISTKTGERVFVFTLRNKLICTDAESDGGGIVRQDGQSRLDQTGRLTLEQT